MRRGYKLYNHGGIYLLITNTPELSRKVNKVLDYYKDAKFIAGDEPVFKFGEKDLDKLKHLLGDIKLDN